MNPRRQTLLSCCTILGGALLAATAADAQTLGRLVTISHGTIFKQCTADNAGSQPGTLYRGSAIEPWIAVDPTTAGHLLTAVQQDRWSNGGARGLRGAVSVNGGRNWTTTSPQGVSLCQGGRLQRSTDPWSAFGLDGTAYFFSLGFNNNPSPPINGESGMFVSRSTDGGLTWSPQTALIDDTDPLAFNDKNSLSTDPNIPGNVYAVWDRLYGPPTAFRAPGGSDEHPNAAQAAIAHDGLQMARNRIAASQAAAAAGAKSPVSDTFGPTYYARSTDSGLTWSRASPIYDPGKGAQTIANLVVGQPSGKLLDFFTHIDAQGNTSIATVSSFDHGFSWTTAAALVTPTIPIGAVTPESHKPLRDASLLFSPTVDPNNGNLYVAWEQPSGHTPRLASIVFTESTDNGKTWSAGAKINQTPANRVNPLRGQAFDPTIVAAPDGTLVATYYDFRNDTGPAGTELADAWVLFCKPAGAAPTCTDPAKWGHEQRLTDVSFNITQAPFDGGYFLGDYFGLVAQGGMVWPAFTAVVGPGKTDLYTRPIRLGATVAAQ